MARYIHRTLAHPRTQNIVHIGDSYRATSPQLGQGANMALLDAAALAHGFKTRSHLDSQIEEYARLRRLHTLLYQATSKLFTPVYQSDSTALPFLRDHIVSRILKIPPVPKILGALVAGTLGRPLKEMSLKPFQSETMQ